MTTLKILKTTLTFLALSIAAASAGADECKKIDKKKLQTGLSSVLQTQTRIKLKDFIRVSQRDDEAIAHVVINGETDYLDPEMKAIAELACINSAWHLEKISWGITNEKYIPFKRPVRLY